MLNASTSDGPEPVRYTCGTGTNQALDGGRRGHPGSFPSERHSDQQAWGTTLTSWRRSQKGPDKAARLLAMTNISAADAAIACWDAKLAYVAWRPVHAVQRADTGGNPATVADPSWQPLLNVNHPEYTSGHSCVSTAVTTALQAYFHRNNIKFTVSSTITGTTRT